MSWPCFMVSSIRQGEWEPCSDGQGQIRQNYFTLPDGKEVAFNDLPVGAMWWSDIEPRKHAERSLCVVLPGKTIWRMHEAGTNGFRWSITGEAPKVTATPSINCVGIYHGWVKDGVVTDDCEGRKFDLMGKRLP